MTKYSHSKLNTFKQCKLKYKYQYIDKLTPDIPNTIEAFMGSMVHETLEKLYRDMKETGKVNSKEQLLLFYNTQWEKQYTDDILIVKQHMTKEQYKETGKIFLIQYYDTFFPFNQTQTVGVETEDFLNLNDDKQYHIRIDRLSTDNQGTYYIQDFKTSSRLKTQQQIDEDAQLAMYSLWVKQNFEDCKSVKLIWNFLAHNQTLISQRTDEQLEILKQDTEALIEEIEATDSFPATQSILCRWCGFQNTCPHYKPY